MKTSLFWRLPCAKVYLSSFLGDDELLFWISKKLVCGSQWKDSIILAITSLRTSMKTSRYSFVVLKECNESIL